MTFGKNNKKTTKISAFFRQYMLKQLLKNYFYALLPVFTLYQDV